MNSVPARHRGAASGMRVTFAQTGLPLSMGLFFTLLVFGLNDKVPSAMYSGLVAHGVPVVECHQAGPCTASRLHIRRFLGPQPLEEPARLQHFVAPQRREPDRPLGAVLSSHN